MRPAFAVLIASYKGLPSDCSPEWTPLPPPHLPALDRCSWHSLAHAALADPPAVPVLRFRPGLDGCSPPAYVLTSEAAAANNSNTFVSPTVSSYTKRGSPEEVALRASEGTVFPPTAAEVEAAAARPDPDSAWLGCIIAPNAIMAGKLVQVQRVVLCFVGKVLGPGREYMGTAEQAGRRRSDGRQLGKAARGPEVDSVPQKLPVS